jgi:glycine/D-amino acid oxidase-like deaminating enzyme
VEKRFISGAEQPPSADVVILGGGPAGTAALWAINRAAPDTRILLIEKSDRLGAGSSTASLEAFRTCWPCLPLARQMQRSVEVPAMLINIWARCITRSPSAARVSVLCIQRETVDGFKADVRRCMLMNEHIELLDADEVRYPLPGSVSG